MMFKSLQLISWALVKPSSSIPHVQVWAGGQHGLGPTLKKQTTLDCPCLEEKECEDVEMITSLPLDDGLEGKHSLLYLLLNM